MRKLIAAVCGTALIGVSSIAVGQTTPSGNMATTPSGHMAGKSMEFKMMDANSDGWVTREEYLAFYGTRYDSMKRNDKGYVSWSDMQMMDGKFYSNNPTASGPAAKGGSGAPKATGGGSN